MADITIMAWIRTTEDGVVFSLSSEEGRWPEPGSKAMLIRDGRLSYDAAPVGASMGETVVADGTWHHVAVTYHGTRGADKIGNKITELLFPNYLYLYVDGRRDGDAYFPTSEVDTPEHVARIGMCASGIQGANHFRGDIDEVSVYSRKLNPAEIHLCYSKPRKGPLDGCVGHWSFDADAEDQSGSGNHGVAKNVSPVKGVLGQAYHFNENGYVTIPDSQHLRFTRKVLERIQQDFADDVSLREIGWELQDNIWKTDWDIQKPGMIAQRYVNACATGAYLTERLEQAGKDVTCLDDLRAMQSIYLLYKHLEDRQSPLLHVHFRALRMAIEDLVNTFGKDYPLGKSYLAQLDTTDDEILRLLEQVVMGDTGAIEEGQKLVALNREALLSNPLLDFDQLLVINHDQNDYQIKQGVKSRCLPRNYESNSSVTKTGYDNEIAVLSPVCSEGDLTTLYKPQGSELITDVDLHFDADRLMFSMPGDNGMWQIFEIGTDGTGLRLLPLIEQPDVDNYDSCYLPDDNVIFSSSACFKNIPCIGGDSHVATLYRLETQTGAIRQLCFDQDHNWCPTVLHNGRILYTRWEYTDIPHYTSRLVFHMNPDGTEQMEYYGSNSYWPPTTLMARPVPNHPTRFVAVISGHHNTPRMGELVLFDPAVGRQEADGAIQRIPGYGKKIIPFIKDCLVEASWPKFLHPFPLSDTYFIVSAKLNPNVRWGIYLVDVFDNMLLLKAVQGRDLMEPVPLRKTKRPPVIPSRVKPDQKDALVYMADVYVGDGLKGIPRGTIKRLRLITYHFVYHGMGGQVNRVGMDGPWDVKRVLGTVPVEPDGSALFRVPANTPISVQPLDAEGKAVQLMRSWMTAMPGETLSCVGCHEKQSSTPPVKPTIAARRAPSKIEPFYGPTRGFSFNREVQSVLDKKCIACHNDLPRNDGKTIPDFQHKPDIVLVGTKCPPSYHQLRCFVRTNTLESDMHLLIPGEYHADTTELIQKLHKGHHGVQLNQEEWERLITWIDLHAPAQGTWHEVVGEKRVNPMRDRRRAMYRRYGGRGEDPEEIINPYQTVECVPLPPVPPSEPAIENIVCEHWPLSLDEAKERQNASCERERVIDLGESVKLELVFIPAGQFVMGDSNGHPDERPLSKVVIEEPFWMGRFEVTNEQYRRFEPAHDSRYEPGDFIQLREDDRGKTINEDHQPVARISWERAVAFCEWLSETTGESFGLPSEAQWEYACRAGTDTPFWYGDLGTDFSDFANFADIHLRWMDSFDFEHPSSTVPAWRPANEHVNDAYHVSAPVGSYASNPWGLYDMHGNVWEWTRSDYQSYSNKKQSGNTHRKVIRGGSWYDRSMRGRSAFRLSYPYYQGVYNVGFRVVCEMK